MYWQKRQHVTQSSALVCDVFTAFCYCSECGTVDMGLILSIDALIKPSLVHDVKRPSHFKFNQWIRVKPPFQVWWQGQAKVSVHSSGNSPCWTEKRYWGTGCGLGGSPVYFGASSGKEKWGTPLCRHCTRTVATLQRLDYPQPKGCVYFGSHCHCNVYSTGMREGKIGKGRLRSRPIIVNC